MTAIFYAIGVFISIFELIKLIYQVIKKQGDRKEKIKRIAVIVLAIVVIIVIFLIDENKTIIVDNYTKMTKEEACELADSQRLDIDIKEEYNYSINTGVVYDQSPKVGNEIKKGETITVYVSLGPAPVVLGDYLGMSLKTASVDLEKMHLKIKAEYAYNSEYKEGTIFDQKPRPKSECFEGDEITFFVSKGGAPVLVEDYVGMTLDEAKAAVQNQNLVPRTIMEYNDEVDKDIVFRQSPDHKKSISEGSTVNLYVSKGHNPVIVDNYIGKNGEEAKQAAEKAGLEVVIEEEQNEEYDPGVVFDQLPKDGTEVSYGGKLILKISFKDPYPGTTVTSDPQNVFTYVNLTQWDSSKDKDILGFSTGNRLKISVSDMWNNIDGKTGSHIVADMHMPFGSRFKDTLVFSFIPALEMQNNKSYADISIIADGKVIFPVNGNSFRLESNTTKRIETAEVSTENVNEMIIRYDCQIYNNGFIAGIDYYTPE